MSVDQLLSSFGYLGIFILIYAETGAFIGFFLPGDTLLITAGIFCAQGRMNLLTVFVVVLLASLLGNATGYYLGKRYGKRLFIREDGTFFKKSHLEKARSFYNKHGGKTIIIARFIAGIRALAPLVAGMSDMPAGKFLSYSFLGGVFWATVLPLFGLYLGNTIPQVDQYILPIVIIAVIISLSPGIIHLLQKRFKK